MNKPKTPSTSQRQHLHPEATVPQHIEVLSKEQQAAIAHNKAEHSRAQERHQNREDQPAKQADVQVSPNQQFEPVQYVKGHRGYTVGTIACWHPTIVDQLVAAGVAVRYNADAAQPPERKGVRGVHKG